MSTTDHLQTVRDLLVDDGRLTGGEWTIKACSYDEADDLPVVSMVEAGGSATPYLGVDYDDHTQIVQVTVRHRGRAEARDAMRIVDSVLTSRSPAGYVKVTKRAGPRYAGVDDEDAHTHTIDVTCEITE